jgi:FtsP/CotA-like multicopper oxidase with cupredoxin domain
VDAELANYAQHAENDHFPPCNAQDHGRHHATYESVMTPARGEPLKPLHLVRLHLILHLRLNNQRLGGFRGSSAECASRSCGGRSSSGASASRVISSALVSFLIATLPAHSEDACKRPAEGAVIAQPHQVTSKNGVLKVALTIRSAADSRDNIRYCYVDEQGNQAPTLRVAPGDLLHINLTNAISPGVAGKAPAAARARGKAGARQSTLCAGSVMTAASTNLHFHGLVVPPVCHQDETLRTLIQPDDPPFEYRVRIPKDQPPGLYWYHPHIHGFSETQLLGGASGAIIVEGIQTHMPRLQGLPERLFVIRDEWMPTPTTAEKADPNRPTKQLSINYVPVPYPKYPPAVIKMRPRARELWRVLNASADTYLSLYVQFGEKRQNVELVGLDGVPLHYGEVTGESYTPETPSIFLPPATRAEFVVTGPSEGESGRLMTGYVYRGADEDSPTPKGSAPPGVRAGQDDVDAARPLASITVSADFPQPALIGQGTAVSESQGMPLSSVRPARTRTLYFSEALSSPNDPASPTLFFITAQGQTPAVFDPNSTEPNVTVRQGDVEDWNIENRSRETHTFHIHQMHFIVVGRRNSGWEEPTLRDTVNLPGWSGFGSYPRLTLRMDFRSPSLIGTFPFHCHIAQHLDGGMMGTVRVEPAFRQ